MDSEKHKKVINTTIQNIRKFRELKDITREQMAADLDLSLSGYSKLERGEIEITLKRLCEIADILEVELHQLLNFNPQTIFNISNSQGVQGFDQGGNYHFHSEDKFREKYILLLEQQLEEMIKSRRREISNGAKTFAERLINDTE
jgi:transcriptional regulator with XRE-family HTH domain